ncbi:hypothetical protein [Legionella quateirensis]|uniref:Coiled-coil protein n=1 Tax=Legionella quateirensis TaxID=45072 RepID=A0A378L140_9GAMM|nr:hypothetical protein [Legionella quateirensis]KTD50944.1 coiled-coil protein [Legionella quateirensis]STY17810.1 coiled-coil protein [Legionella quateirensis]
MPKIHDIKKQCDLIRGLYHSRKEDTLLPVCFHNEKVTLINTQYVDERRFISDAPVPNGELLGKGGIKHVYHINGKAVFLVACYDINRLEQIIDEEVSISQEMNKRGLHAQELNKGYIGIYDPDSDSYLDYPCMFADSFSTLSLEKGIEVFDTKNLYRFGSKYKLFHSDDGCMDNSVNRIVFQDILNDLALLLYLGFDINDNDSVNLTFVPSEREGIPFTVRLFMYDFSSKSYTPKMGPSPVLTLPEDARIKILLKGIVRNVLEADHIARSGRRSIVTPKFINTFFDTIYPAIEDEFVNCIKNKIIQHISTHSAPNIVAGRELVDLQIKFNDLLATLQIKTKELIAKGTEDNTLFDPRYVKIGKAAATLNQELEKAGNQFFANPTATNFPLFKQACNAAIKTAAVEFKNNRSSWSIKAWNEINPILRGILGIVALLTFIPALIVAMKSRHGYFNTFFSKLQTDSFEQLQSFERGQEDIMQVVGSLV